MNFRTKAFLLHISSSATVLGLMLGGLYLGWYRWPGWYVTSVTTVIGILVGVDLTLGPLLTLLIANPKKPRRELARDVAVIVTVQLIALVYGVSTLWMGRPLYYVFWVNELKVVVASRVPSSERALTSQQNPDFAPHWYSLPRWAWAPLPASHADPIQLLTKVVPMPHDFKPLSQAGDELRARLRNVDRMSVFLPQERQVLKQRMVQQGLSADAPDALFLSGGGRPLLVVFDPTTLRIKAFIRAN